MPRDSAPKPGTCKYLGLAALALSAAVGVVAQPSPPTEEGPFDRLIFDLQEKRLEQALNPNAPPRTSKDPRMPAARPATGVTPAKGGPAVGGGAAKPGPLPGSSGRSGNIVKPKDPFVAGPGVAGAGKIQVGRSDGKPGPVRPESGVEALGLEVRVRDGEPVVGAVRSASPAEAAGARPGDRILIVAGKAGKGQTAEQVAALLRAAAGPEVKVAVARGEEVLLLKIAQNAEPSPRIAEEKPVKPAGEQLSLVGFDPREWKLSAAGQGQVTREDDDLVVKVPANSAGGVEGWSRLPLRGDFTLDFGHFLGEWEHQAGDTLAVEFKFGAMPGGEAPLVIRRRVDAAGKDILEILTPGQNRVVNVSQSQLTLQFRRKGARLLLSRFDQDSGDQVPIASFTQGLADSVFIGLTVQKAGAAPLSVNVYLSNGEPIELK